MPPIDDFDANLINSMAGEKLGVPQSATPEAPAPAPTPEPAPAPAQKAKETPQDKAQTDMSPKTENNASKDAPFEFLDVEINGSKRQYTPDQLRGITSRYSDLNYKHQTQVAPISKSVEMLNSLREQAGLDGEGVYSLLNAALTAYQKNPTMGNGSAQPPAQTNTQPGRENIDISTHSDTAGMSLDEQLAHWEQNNGVTVPPAFKEMLGKTGKLEEQITQLSDMLKSMAQNGMQATSQAEGALQKAKSIGVDTARQTIVNNLDKVQMKYQLPQEAANDFLAFVQGRGYDISELLDYSLTDKLAVDFRNNMNAPELQRFKDIAARRQAFTGNVSPTPGLTGSTPAPAPTGNPQNPQDDPTFNQLADSVIRKREDMRKI